MSQCLRSLVDGFSANRELLGCRNQLMEKGSCDKKYRVSSWPSGTKIYKKNPELVGDLQAVGGSSDHAHASLDTLIFQQFYPN